MSALIGYHYIERDVMIRSGRDRGQRLRLPRSAALWANAGKIKKQNRQIQVQYRVRMPFTFPQFTLMGVLLGIGQIQDQLRIPDEADQRSGMMSITIPG